MNMYHSFASVTKSVMEEVPGSCRYAICYKKQILGQCTYIVCSIQCATGLCRLLRLPQFWALCDKGFVCVPNVCICHCSTRVDLQQSARAVLHDHSYYSN